MRLERLFGQPDSSGRKYSLGYTPAESVPGTLKAFLWNVIRKNPRTWIFHLSMDVLHHTRYPIAFILLSFIIDDLAAQSSTSVPESVWWYMGGIFVVLLIGELSHIMVAQLVIRWFGWMRPQIRSDLLNYTLGHSYQFLQDHFAGSLSRKITEATESTLRLNDTFRFNIISPLITMIFATVSVFFMHPLYGGLFLAFVLAITVPVILRLGRIHERSQDYSIARANVTGRIVDGLSNAVSVKSFANRDREIAELHRHSESEIRTWMKLTRNMVQLENFRRLSLVAFGAGAVLACILGWQHGLVTVGQISAIVGMAFQMTGSTWTLGNGLVQTTDAMGYISDALNIVSVRHGIKDRPGAPDLKVTKGEITFRNAGFAYPGQPVFKNLNLQIPPRQRVGLLGSSGAGKSTLVALLIRFYDLNEGRLEIDGHDISEVTQASLRRNVAVIPQDTSLFHRSLLDNIRYGRPDADDNAVVAAAKKAHAHEFISTLPQGYDTLVGERGVKLSGGQRQRIAIARAILKDAPILLLDEATSALDSESEHYIQDSLKEIMQDKTVIAIAHRLSTIAHLDRLIVMEGGRIMEDGSHHALINQDGIYARLWAMQSGGFLQDGVT